MEVRLTQKQELFTQNLFKGMSQRDAYTGAGYSSEQLPDTLDRNAFELARSNKIVARLEELNERTEDKSVATVTERKQRLTEVLRDKAQTPIHAIAELNKMDGSYAPDKLDIRGEILITPNMRALAVKEMLETKEEEARLLKEGKDGQDSQGKDETLQGP